VIDLPSHDSGRPPQFNDEAELRAHATVTLHRKLPLHRAADLPQMATKSDTEEASEP
jgi:hypothetical protein